MVNSRLMGSPDRRVKSHQRPESVQQKHTKIVEQQTIYFTDNVSVLTSTSVQMGLELELSVLVKMFRLFFLSSSLLHTYFRAAFKVFCVNSLCSDFFLLKGAWPIIYIFFRDLQRVRMRKQQRAAPMKNWREFRARTHIEDGKWKKWANCAFQF